MSGYKNQFESTTKPYERYIEELKAWCMVTDLEKKKQGIAIALSLPENDPSGVRDKVFSEVTLDKLHKTDGVETLMTYLDSLFKKDELSEVYERYINFDRYQRDPEQEREEFVLEFEKLDNRVKQRDMGLPQAVLAFKLLDASKLPHRDRQLVLTGVDYSQKDNLFDQMKASLKSFMGNKPFCLKGILPA